MTQNHGRKHARVKFSSLAKITFADQSSESFPINDISLAGLSFRSQNKLFDDEECCIELTENWDRTSYTFTIRGKVVRTTDRGAAIKFLSMQPKTFMMLQTSLLYRCNDPLALGEEFAGTCPVNLDEISAPQTSPPILSKEIQETSWNI